MPIRITASLEDGARFTLKKAVLVYTDGSGAIATMHDVRIAPDGATLCPGTVAGQDALTELAHRLLAQAPGLDFLPERCLATGMRRTVWWCPPGKRHMFFDRKHPEVRPIAELSAPGTRHDRRGNLEGATNSRTRRGRGIGNDICGHIAAHPGLVFVAGDNRLDVYALATDARPTPETELFVAPYPNVSPNGNVCLGTADVPRRHGPSTIGAWERGFFESTFTHAHAGGDRITRYSGGVYRLWKHVIESGSFPSEALLPAKRTLGQLLAGGSR
jgi:hypothetical protein